MLGFNKTNEKSYILYFHHHLQSRQQQDCFCMACVSKDTDGAKTMTYSCSPKIYCCYTLPDILLNKQSYNNINYAQNRVFIYSESMCFEYLSKQAALNRKFTYISLHLTENYVMLTDVYPLPSNSHPFKQ